MNCCKGHCVGFDQEFNLKRAKKDLKNFLKNGPVKTTQSLIDAVKPHAQEGNTLLDVGGGIGAIQYALLELGVKEVSSIDASSSYIELAKEETARRGFQEKIKYLHGDFVQVHQSVIAADIVTLDRVVCCYADYEVLVSLSLKKAKKLYALVIPSDSGWVKFFHAIEVGFRKLLGKEFRGFIHPVSAIEKIIYDEGFQKEVQNSNFGWLTLVYLKKR